MEDLGSRESEELGLKGKMRRGQWGEEIKIQRWPWLWWRGSGQEEVRESL